MTAAAPSPAPPETPHETPPALRWQAPAARDDGHGRIALLYPDGSVNVLARGATLADAARERAFADCGELGEPTRIAVVDILVRGVAPEAANGARA